MSRTRVVRVIAAVIGAALLISVLWVAGQPGVLARTTVMCDGSVPAWYPSTGGCSEIPSLLEHLWPPERWAAPSWCQGMCISGEDESADEIRVRDEWRAAHPGAVAH
jgi:hypothetical protein